MYKNKSLIALLAFERRRSGVRSGGKGPFTMWKEKVGGGQEKGKKEVLISLREGMKFGSIILFFIHIPSFHPTMPIWRYICF